MKDLFLSDLSHFSILININGKPTSPIESLEIVARLQFGVWCKPYNINEYYALTKAQNELMNSNKGSQRKSSIEKKNEVKKRCPTTMVTPEKRSNIFQTTSSEKTFPSPGSAAKITTYSPTLFSRDVEFQKMERELERCYFEINDLYERLGKAEEGKRDLDEKCKNLHKKVKLLQNQEIGSPDINAMLVDEDDEKMKCFKADILRMMEFKIENGLSEFRRNFSMEMKSFISNLLLQYNNYSQSISKGKSSIGYKSIKQSPIKSVYQRETYSEPKNKKKNNFQRFNPNLSPSLHKYNESVPNSGNRKKGEDQEFNRYMSHTAPMDNLKNENAYELDINYLNSKI